MILSYLFTSQFKKKKKKLKVKEDTGTNAIQEQNWDQNSWPLNSNFLHQTIMSYTKG